MVVCVVLCGLVWCCVALCGAVWPCEVLMRHCVVFIWRYVILRGHCVINVLIRLYYNRLDWIRLA